MSEYANLTPYLERCLFKRTIDDDAAFAAFTEGLPEREDMTPYHCGPHSLRALRMAYEIAGKPANVLEVGFCLGHSASMWFGFGAENVASIDNSDRAQTIQAARYMKGKHGDRFHLFHTSSDRLIGWQPSFKFGLMFIDGGHEFAEILADIDLGLSLGIPYLLFDDFYERWGPGTQPAIESRGLVILTIIGNQALCVASDKFQ